MDASSDTNQRSWLGRIFKALQPRSPEYKHTLQVLEAAIEIADSRIRLASSYRPKALPAIEHAMAYSHELVAAIPGPVELAPQQYHSEPLLRAIFHSPEQITEVQQRLLAEKSRLSELSREMVALLTMSREIKTTFGQQQHGQMVMRDVAMQTVDFHDLLLVAPSQSVESTRTLLREKVMEILATTVMTTIAELREELTELRERRTHLHSMKWILRGKSHALSQLAPPDHATRKKITEVDKQLQATEKAIAEKQAHIGEPEKSLDHFISIMMQPAASLSIRELSLTLNWMNAIVDNEDQDDVHTISLAEFAAGGELQRQGILVRVSTGP